VVKRRLPQALGEAPLCRFMGVMSLNVASRADEVPDNEMTPAQRINVIGRDPAGRVRAGRDYAALRAVLATRPRELVNPAMGQAALADGAAPLGLPAPRAADDGSRALVHCRREVLNPITSGRSDCGSVVPPSAPDSPRYGLRLPTAADRARSAHRRTPPPAVRYRALSCTAHQLMRAIRVLLEAGPRIKATGGAPVLRDPLRRRLTHGAQARRH